MVSDGFDGGLNPTARSRRTECCAGQKFGLKYLFLLPSVDLERLALSCTACELPQSSRSGTTCLLCSPPKHRQPRPTGSYRSWRISDFGTHRQHGIFHHGMN
ncbi:uncharacterized protein BDZ83DRAFT_163300 [Colletotrichum acutatum]|uniref:Uncharacterized protein n=1 Tax=Glomerella acutata TaxID=27357 RepID=A0AAD8XQI7_GLOAC|nr:uncharacterized protein BDZ83DRAFT_163300 [Colletotrichum acutatum]KAK1731564.1 hypothetical protein BDZ83DRAFT_163300 [Colletotrichum acutatum]